MIRKLLLLLVILIIVQIVKAQQAQMLASCFYDSYNSRIVVRLAIRNNTSSSGACEIAAIRIGFQFNEIVLNYAGYKSLLYNGTDINSGLNDNTFYSNSTGDFDSELTTPINDGTRIANYGSGATAGSKILRKNYFNRSTSSCLSTWNIPPKTYRIAFEIYFTFKAGYTPADYNLNTSGYGWGTSNFIAQFITSLNENLIDSKKEIAIVVEHSSTSPYQPWDMTNCNNGNIDPVPINNNSVYFVNPMDGILSGNVQSLTAAEKNNNIQLDWKVENNELVDHYELERKEENGEFKTIAMIMSDNKYATTSYKYNDKITVREQQLYYRVKTVGLDQVITYSDVKTIKLRSVQQPNIKVYPNPSSDLIRVDLPIATGSYVCRLYNSEGRMVKVENISYPNSGIHINALVNGNYFVELYHPQSGKRFYSQFTKQ
jgi:Secretion system C-terminal sorting domain